ncbi:bifunctional transcriptional activator/DNA repair enzyme AdaA [Peribacillus sp. SCS-26]|uniref:bifunctional transcriptional activator/DNA repair enzyme AdaA n=1 Tax=Paraperibacillus marinus TaxID=3115295 RepID=UPI0039062946
MSSLNFSFEEMWDKIMACDRAYDGLFYTAVKTTRIYCRPSCRSRKPKKVNVEFFRLKHEAEAAGYRACKRCQPEVERSPHESLVQEIAAYLAGHYKESVTLADISRQIGVSASYLERVFKAETNETPRSYLDKVRIDKAAHMLRQTDLSGAEISYEAGFHSLSNFYKVFRSLMHCSPGEYRSALKDGDM